MPAKRGERPTAGECYRTSGDANIFARHARSFDGLFVSRFLVSRPHLGRDYLPKCVDLRIMLPGIKRESRVFTKNPARFFKKQSGPDFWLKPPETGETPRWGWSAVRRGRGDIISHYPDITYEYAWPTQGKKRSAGRVKRVKRGSPAGYRGGPKAESLPAA